MPSDPDIARAVVGLLLFGMLAYSALLWFFHLGKENKRSERPAYVHAWPIGWVNFGIFLCALIISVFFTQLLAANLVGYFAEPPAEEILSKETKPFEKTIDPNSSEISEDAGPSAPTAWFMVLSVLTLQIPMVLTFYGLRKFDSKSFSGALNYRSVSIRKAIAETTPYFIRYLPIIWLVSGAWAGFLNRLQRFGILDELPPQQIVTLLSNGEHTVAVLLLSVSAVALAPFVEEIIFRGAIYRFFKGYTSVFMAQIISGALFAAMHFNLMSFLPLLFIGVLFAQLYEKEGNILLPMLFHAYWNGLNLFMLFMMNRYEIPLWLEQ
jgi:membrane protease YdiL (CAAX protease family)